MEHIVVNNVNPGTSKPIKFPNGSEAKLVVVNDSKTWQNPDDPSLGRLEDWWPMAESTSVAMKLMYRIMREGQVLPCLTAIALAILAEVYTTTSEEGSQERRIRLKYRSSPIADFGIVKGSAKVTPEDRMAYARMSDKSIVYGQDPDDHYWLYFTTIRGEEVILDFAMFTFNMCLMVPTKPYISPELNAQAPYAPVFFCDRPIRTSAPHLYVERKRVSVLRNPALHEAIVHTREALYDSDTPIIHKFMEDLAGRPMTKTETDLTYTSLIDNCRALSCNLVQERRWAQYPAAAPQAIHGDPGELQVDNLPLPGLTRLKRPAKTRK